MMVTRLAPAALFALLIGGCTVGEVSTDGSGDDGTMNNPIDAPTGVTADAPTTTTDADLGPAKDRCEPKGPLSQAHIHADAPANDRRGLACMDAGCHAAGGAGGQFGFAGTAYTTNAGTAPRVGSVVRLMTPDGATVIAQAVTDSAGNFHYGGPLTQPGPYLVDITECGLTPDKKQMPTQVTGAQTNCNQGGCHAMPGNNPINFP